MKRAAIAAGTLGIVLVLIALAVRRNELARRDGPWLAPAPATPHTAAASDTGTQQGFLYGRITTVAGTTLEGRLRWGGSQEAFWGDYFNGYKEVNPWAVHVPAEEITESRPVELFGMKIVDREVQVDLMRPLMARFGDIRRIEALGRDIRVTLKNGSVFELDRLNADDLADGLRVWDAQHGIVDFHERQIDSVELLPTPPLDDLPARLHGTAHTSQGEFTGFVQWDLQASVGTDELAGRSADGPVRLRFDTVSSITRRPDNGSRVTLLDGGEIELSRARRTGPGRPRIAVDDPRYGRVLVLWTAFERIDFSPAGRSPAYDDYPPGEPLSGAVTTRDGRRLTGRLVYDLDESQTTETLDSSDQALSYTIPFGLIASIVLPPPDERASARARLTLHSGETLSLECAGDLGADNLGLLVFAADGDEPGFVRWTDVERIDLDRPAAMYPPIGGPPPPNE